MKKTLAILLAVVMALSLMAACGSTANTPAAEEPAKTGDAGIALYAGLSLLALSGSGWAVGKKRRGEK